MTDFLRSGRPSLDLAWTVRFRNVWPTETLTDRDALRRWLVGTYPSVDFDADMCTQGFLDEITALRELIYSMVVTAIAQKPMQQADQDLINWYSDGPRLRHRLRSDRTADIRASSATQFLTELAIDAINVLSSEADRLRLCEGPNCALPFLDESRGGTRRWCTAQRCGNRVNTRAYRRRAKA